MSGDSIVRSETPSVRESRARARRCGTTPGRTGKQERCSGSFACMAGTASHARGAGARSRRRASAVAAPGTARAARRGQTLRRVRSGPPQGLSRARETALGAPRMANRDTARGLTPKPSLQPSGAAVSLVRSRGQGLDGRDWRCGRHVRSVLPSGVSVSGSASTLPVRPRGQRSLRSRRGATPSRISSHRRAPATGPSTSQPARIRSTSY